MCFFGATPMRSQVTPTATNDEARRRVLMQQVQNEQMQGRRATILTSPLGVPNTPAARPPLNRTVLAGV